MGAKAEPVLPMAPRLRNVECQIVVLYGQQDWVVRMTPHSVPFCRHKVRFEHIPEAGMPFKVQLPHAYIATGHLPFYENPDMFNSALSKHLPTDHDPTGVQS
jgi:pimeloyl-ACP methyl ester carboxylesterase